MPDPHVLRRPRRYGRTACEPLRRRLPGNPGPSRSACWPAAPWPGSCATCTAGPTRARCAITRCCGRCCASSAMARKAGALRHALGRHARPDRLLQHPASRGRCRPPDPERSVGGRYRLLELDLPAVMGVNGSIALRRSHPHLRFAYYAMLDAGFVSRRRDLVADVLAQDLLLFVTPEVLRGIAQLFLRTTFVAASRSSKKCTSARTCPARSRNNWRGRCVTTRIWCCSTPMRRSIRWVSAWIRPEGSSAAARWPIAPCNCWSGWDFARSICMVWTCAGECFAAFLRVRRCAPAERAGQAVRLTHPACLSRRQPVARRARPADLQPVARQRPGRACFPSAIGRR